MSETLKNAQCFLCEGGFRLVITPSVTFSKVNLVFLDGADKELEVAVESPVPEPGRSNWAVRDAEGRPVEKVRTADESGTRKLTVYACLDPMTECSFIIRAVDPEREALTYLSYVSISVTDAGGETHRLGFLRLQ
ncbi:hypothetical protein OG312_00360 [Kocuria rhizophila]|uniref:hypothetical protein n=1 Tax=Kocuria rhizophila TaxID=72000 RepID=UPI000F5362F6|nr:hypothetical protein [Kocuria rhizophila]MXN61685.1 hypothetical protein [Bacillus sp. BGMRC0062]WSQ05168.1 hypothetical protein OG312_00360 [Kocuria rhizophila]